MNSFRGWIILFLQGHHSSFSTLLSEYPQSLLPNTHTTHIIHPPTTASGDGNKPYSLCIFTASPGAWVLTHDPNPASPGHTAASILAD